MFEDFSGTDRHLTDLANAIAGEESDLKGLRLLEHGRFVVIFVVVILVVSVVSQRLAIGLLVLLIISSLILRYPNIPFIGGR